MPTPTEGRVAVYIDFDNIVISRYDQKHGAGQFHRDKARQHNASRTKAVSAVGTKLAQATVDVGAILDYASSFGTIAIGRAYADWSVPVNASYHRQLVDRAVDLVQLFPVTAAMKNGADIRLAVDVVEDLFRLPDITHIVVVAGDSDYIALAQRAKKLGRYVVGIGVAGGTSKALTAACDEFADYDALPGLDDDDDTDDAETRTGEPAGDAAAKQAQKKPDQKDDKKAASSNSTGTETAQLTQQQASRLLVRAMRLLQAKDDSEWLGSSSVKNQMLRMDSSFQESALGHKTFTDFVKSRGGLVELKEHGQRRELRLRSNATAPK